MKRPKTKPKKTRVNITLDEELFIDSGKYISNLSAFFNTCLRNYVVKAQLDEWKKEKNDNNIRYNQSFEENKKSYSPEQLDEFKKIIRTKWTRE